MEEEVRVQKYLADCGVASRRAAEELIRAGLVKIGGRPAAIGDKINPARDTVTVRGKRVRAAARRRTIMLHKPRGIITTMKDEQGRKCVADLIGDVSERVFPVGRLDRESEGLLLLTGDGALTQALTHPRGEVPKVYRVTIKGVVSAAQLAALRGGVMIDGARTAPAKVSVLLAEPERTVLQMTLTEGRNREIRRMCEALSLKVARLKRTEIAGVKLGMLPPGKWRDLTAEELKLLKNSEFGIVE